MTKGAIQASDKSESISTDPKKTGSIEHPVNLEKLNIGREFMDVTWRMAVPVVIFAGLGLLADKSLGSKPWLTLLGTMVGFLFAAYLVKRQIGTLPQDDPDMIAISRAKRAAEKDQDEVDE